MDSSIAPHLRRERTFPTRKADDYEPPFPAWSARFPVSTTTVVMAYFGVQFTGDEPPVVAEALGELTAALRSEQGPGTVDRARYVDEEGYDTRIVIAYWDDTLAFDHWLVAHPWVTPSRGGQGAGFFTEVVRPTIEQFETLFANDRLEGVAELSNGLSDDTVREHGYWGGARDRIPAGQTDRLAPEGTPTLAVDGAIRTVRSGHHPCLIRSGQEWTEAVGEDRRMYLEEVEPQLRAGMDFLRDEGLGIGCYVNRYMTCADEDWNPLEKTFGLSWWHSISELDGWAESHPTHLDIFQAALRYFGAMGGDAHLRLYHEVTVPDRDRTLFTYLDCHDRTGMLRAFA